MVSDRITITDVFATVRRVPLWASTFLAESAALDRQVRTPAAGRLVAAAAMLVLAVVVAECGPVNAQPAASKPPLTLKETGLYVDAEKLRVDPGHLAFAPQYPLWTDGAVKRRWISLPRGTAIDGSDPDAWIFPAGTRFWKEFSFGGRRVETRFLQRQVDGQWLYAAYAWTPDGRDALLVSTRGRRGVYPLGGGRSHAIPGVSDCKVCHQGGRSEVLGFTALQLSPARDPDALHAERPPLPSIDLAYLVASGLLVGFPESRLRTPPRIAAASASERAVLGYMHGNCGHCHNREGALQNVGLFLRHESDAGLPSAIATTVGRPVRTPAPGQSREALLRVEPGRPDRSALLQRMASRYSALQMPPLGTELVDDQAVASLRRWITELDHSHKTHEGKGRRP